MNLNDELFVRQLYNKNVNGYSIIQKSFRMVDLS